MCYFNVPVSPCLNVNGVPFLLTEGEIFKNYVARLVMSRNINGVLFFLTGRRQQKARSQGPLSLEDPGNEVDFAPLRFHLSACFEERGITQ